MAQLRGVEVLNINELANSLKPVVLPGEIMKVFILKEGKEYNQGVAYLDDGTMVVVDNARKMIGKTIDVVVTSVLQTTAGKMIFGRFIEPSAAAQSRARRRPPVLVPRSPHRPPQRASSAMPPFHWWRTVFFLIPCIAVYTIVLGTLSLVLEPRRPQRILRALVRADVVASDSHDIRRSRVARGLDRLEPGRTYVFVANHQSIFDIPILFWSLAVSAADHRQGVARKHSVHGLASSPHRPHARGPQAA